MRSVPRDFMESLRRRTCHFDLIYNSQNLQGFDVPPRDSFVSYGSQRDESVSPKPFALRTLREQSPAGRWNEEMRAISMHLDGTNVAGVKWTFVAKGPQPHHHPTY